MPNDAQEKIEQRGKTSLVGALVQVPSKSVITLISLIIVTIFCVGCNSLANLSPETRQLAHSPSPLSPQTTPTPTISVFDRFNCLPKNTLRQKGEVVNVIDGDTIDVRLEGGETYRVRYIGMDTPERDESFFDQSTAVNERLVAGRTVTLVKDISETDRFGRLLRYILVADTFVNYELVVRGYAHAVTFPPDVACQGTFLEAQRTAKENNLGLWADTGNAAP
ncbi:MAG: thermonuclease family protein [Anaerolineales bacterium]|nr:thermonuclease family protein [Anaerolineales bacterium]